jgi:hypothetical protein
MLGRELGHHHHGAEMSRAVELRSVLAQLGVRVTSLVDGTVGEEIERAEGSLFEPA